MPWYHAEMLTYPEFNPVALALGPLKIRWYGITYLAGFMLAWWLARVRAGKPESGWTQEQVSDLIFYGALGVVLGGRIGYILFYNFDVFLANPVVLFRVWEGGMSFHGGLLGVIVAMLLFARRYQKRFFTVADFMAPLVPMGLFAGRIGNFINSELWGGPASVPWGMRVHCRDLAQSQAEVLCSSDGIWTIPLHPSQLYEASLEGIALFLILWFFSSRPRPRMAVSGMFLLFYGIFRSIVELVRMPDVQIGYLSEGWITMGQVLSAPMILFGILLIILAYKKNTTRVSS